MRPDIIPKQPERPRACKTPQSSLLGVLNYNTSDRAWPHLVATMGEAPRRPDGDRWAVTAPERRS